MEAAKLLPPPCPATASSKPKFGFWSLTAIISILLLMNLFLGLLIWDNTRNIHTLIENDKIFKRNIKNLLEIDQMLFENDNILQDNDEMLLGNDEKIVEGWKLEQEIGLKNGPMGPGPMGPGSMGPFNPSDTFEPFESQDKMTEIAETDNEDVIGKLTSNQICKIILF